LTNLTAIRPIIRDLFNNDSEFFVIRGKKRSGKTDLMTLLMAGAHEFGYFNRFCGDVELNNCAFQYERIHDLQTLKLYCKSGSGKTFFFFDEMGKNVPKGTPWARLNIEIIKSLEVIRKYKLTMGGAFIGDSVSDLILNDNYLDAWIQKVNLKTAIVHDFRHNRMTRLLHIPRSPITFPEYQDVSFYEKPTGVETTNWLSSAEKLVVQKRADKQPLSGGERVVLSRLKERLLKFYLENPTVTPKQIELEEVPSQSSCTQA
jgi:hypothetical protein